jgi:hypothetical protein
MKAYDYALWATIVEPILDINKAQNLLFYIYVPFLLILCILVRDPDASTDAPRTLINEGPITWQRR